MGSVPGKAARSVVKRGKKGKSAGSRSGNPAKRAAENAGSPRPGADRLGLRSRRANAPSEADLAEIQKLFGKN
jgi:signal recognition particle subunit SRP54